MSSSWLVVATLVFVSVVLASGNREYRRVHVLQAFMDASVELADWLSATMVIVALAGLVLFLLRLVLSCANIWLAWLLRLLSPASP